jgi:hypothetical protein
MEQKIILALAFIFLASSLVSAQFSLPGIPHQFFGTVSDSNGVSAPDGTFVVAKVGSNSVSATVSKSGNYGFNGAEIFYIQDPNSNRAGNTIEFYVNDFKVAESVFQNGQSERLDLTTPEIFPSNSGESDSGSSGGSSSGGGGGGGGTIISTVNNPNQIVNTSACVENWECTDYLDCVNGVQNRVCADKSFCGTTLNSPAESRKCIASETKSGFFSNILGAVIGTKGNNAINISLIVVFLVLVVIITFIVKTHIAKRKSTIKMDLAGNKI